MYYNIDFLIFLTTFSKNSPHSNNCKYSEISLQLLNEKFSEGHLFLYFPLVSSFKIDIVVFRNKQEFLEHYRYINVVFRY